MNTQTILPDSLIIPDKSVDKLNNLNYDPIQRLVKLSNFIDAEMMAMLYDENGEPRRKFSQVAFAALLATQAKIANDLMRYGYARVSEVIETRNLTPEPIKITLSRKQDGESSSSKNTGSN